MTNIDKADAMTSELADEEPFVVAPGPLVPVPVVPGPFVPVEPLVTTGVGNIAHIGSLAEMPRSAHDGTC